jgi:hypothetical protein
VIVIKIVRTEKMRSSAMAFSGVKQTERISGAEEPVLA